MKILGIIAEYNPFHNGHLFHINESLKQTGCDAAVIVMSGDFVQRGAPAILSKHLRAQMALASGAAVVLELPTCYACGSAEYFATGAISLLNSLGCIDVLSFGSESGDIRKLQQIAEILVHEPDGYKDSLRSCLSQGLSYPNARKQAFYNYTKEDSLTLLLDSPNNILGIEYLKALYRTGSTIQPFTVSRQGAAYHEEALHASFSSASAIRAAIFQSNTSENSWENSVFLRQMPFPAARILQEMQWKKVPIHSNDFSLLLKHQLLIETPDSLVQYADVPESLARRIIHQRNNFICWEQFCELLKTKELTYSRISRALLHVLLGITTEDMDAYRKDHDCYYARILGFQKKEADILKVFKTNSQVPVITKLGQTDSLSPAGQHMLDGDCHASNLYESVVTDKFHTPFTEEHSKSMILFS